MLKEKKNGGRTRYSRLLFPRKASSGTIHGWKKGKSNRAAKRELEESGKKWGSNPNCSLRAPSERGTLTKKLVKTRAREGGEQAQSKEVLRRPFPIRKENLPNASITGKKKSPWLEGKLSGQLEVQKVRWKSNWSQG